MIRIALVLPLLLGCAGPPVRVEGGRVSTDPLWNSANRELEPPNSLPPGFVTNHPFPPSTGTLGTRAVP